MRPSAFAWSQGADARRRRRGRWFPRGRRSLDASAEGDFHDVVHGFDERQLNALEEMFGDFLQILLIPTREDHCGELRPFRRQNLFLEPPDRKHAAAQGDFARHRQISSRRRT